MTDKQPEALESLASSIGVVPYSIDADLQGICVIVADAITGALAFGAQEPSQQSTQLAEMILSDCGCNSNYTPLLDRVAGHIEANLEQRISSLQALHGEQQAAPAEGDALTQAARDVLAERQRQITAEGYAPAHDDEHVNDEIAAMACYYVMPPGAREWSGPDGYGATLGDAIRPEGWNAKDCDRRRELVNGAALALAELERLDRASARATQEGKSHE